MKNVYVKNLIVSIKYFNQYKRLIYKIRDKTYNVDC